MIRCNVEDCLSVVRPLSSEVEAKQSRSIIKMLFEKRHLVSRYS